MPEVAESRLILVQAARQRDHHAWNQLLKEHEAPLYVYIAELIRDENAALDLIQEVFAGAVRHIGSLRDDAKFGSWLFAIAHQRCVQHWRNRQRDQRVFAETDGGDEDDLGGTEPDDPRSLLVRKEQSEEFHALVSRLPEPQRAVLLLRTLEGFSLEEIAEVIGAPLGTVKSRLHHATQALKRLAPSQP